MRAVIQRVSDADVVVDGTQVAAIGRGLLVLVGVADEDAERDADVLARKILGLRVFADAEGRMNRDLAAAGGEALVVSQFTLLADLRRGRRPSFTRAARPEVAEPLVRRVAHQIAAGGVPVATGRFGATMRVRLTNEGPVTLVLEVGAGKLT